MATSYKDRVWSGYFIYILNVFKIPYLSLIFNLGLLAHELWILKILPNIDIDQII